MPKKLLKSRLVNYEGYTNREAERLVDVFIQIVKDALISGRSVELEGIGTLVVVRRPQRRRINQNLRNVVPTIETYPKQAKTVKLRSRVDLSWRET